MIPLRLRRLEKYADKFLNDKVLPFFDEHGVKGLRVLTDQESKYCGNKATHPYKRFML